MAKNTKSNPRHQKEKFGRSKLLLATLLVFLAVLAYNFTQNYRIEIKLKLANENEVKKPETAAQQIVHVSEPRPKYWFYMARGYMWIFFSVDNVLKRLGLQKIEIKVDMHEMVHMDWDLLWTYDYQNEIPIDFKKLKYNQKINHIPGNFVLCMKENLAMSTNSKYIPKAFNNSDDIQKYAKEHPEARFVQKFWSNRGVQLKKASEIKFELFGAGYKYFAQIYIENPLLIGGHKFDIGVYVLVTSIDPLRIYYYTKNTLVRMCEKKYNPNNYDDIDSYVISDACLFPWDVEALSVYYNNSYNYKDSMNAYFTKQGLDTDRIWTQVEDCIRSVVLSKEYSYIYWTKKQKFKHSFFELYRFDFILDEALNLYLIEINQSPNVNPSAKLYRDQRMFESLLYDSFNLLGFGHYMKKKSFTLGDDVEEQMICHKENLNVRPETCVSKSCNGSCKADECKLCWNCLSKNQQYELHIAYRETKNRGSMKRVFPPTKADMEVLGDDYLKTLSLANRLHTEWFMEMCKKDKDFC